MAQPPPPEFATRAFTPVANPTYLYNMDASFKQTPQPRHVLDQRVPQGDERLTVAGSTPPVTGLTPIVAMAGQTPFNVWGLYPA